MMQYFPDIKSARKLRKLLESISLQIDPKEKDLYQSEILKPKEFVKHSNGKIEEIPEVNLYFIESEFKFKSLISIIQNILKSLNHVNDYEVVIAILGLFSLIPKQNGDPIENFNFLLSFIEKSNIHQFYILPPHIDQNYFYLKIGSYKFSNLDF